MKFLNILALASLPVFTFAVDKGMGTRFRKFLIKSNATPNLKLDESSFRAITTAPRDYGSLLLLTALPAQFGCKPCREFQPEFETLAKSWHKGDKQGESRMLFGTLDFPDGRGIFQEMQLQTAPLMMYFPPSIGPNARGNGAPIKYTFEHGSVDAEAARAWLVKYLPEKSRMPQIYRPFNWVRFITFVTAVLGLITFLTLFGGYLLPVVRNRNLWAAISLITVLLFTSGHMYNHIRKVPYVTGNGKGGISYFAAGFQTQNGVETQIVAAIYGVLSFATIALALKVPRMAGPKSQQIAAFIWAGVMVCSYSFLMSVFKLKNGSYPFWLPPF